MFYYYTKQNGQLLEGGECNSLHFHDPDPHTQQ